MRKQTAVQHLDIFAQPLHARTLYLSSNIVSCLDDLPHTYHSIQHLCLSSCGINALPNDFGLKFPNVRTLNLNFNNIKDIRPLLNIGNLESLYLSGNRIARLRKCIATLAKLTTLKTVDCRDNPFTQGFYAPISINAKETQLVASDTDTVADFDVETELRIVQETEQAACLLPQADATADTGHMSRLDEDTKLRRRVYELLLANSCRKLVKLDGLEFQRDRAMVKDLVWDRLIKLGVVRKSGREEGGQQWVDLDAAAATV